MGMELQLHQQLELGLDVAFANTGVVIVEDNNVIYGQTIVTGKDKTVKYVMDSHRNRCATIAKELQQVIDKYKPVKAYVELPTGASQSAISSLTMGMAIGVAVTVLWFNKIPAIYVKPIDVKKATDGSYKATKEEVEAVVRQQFNWSTWPKNKGVREHICDALGAILAGRERVCMEV